MRSGLGQDRSSLTELVDALGGRRVLVVGESILDAWLQGASDRLCREAPVPLVTIDRRVQAPGGAANSAVNVAALGGACRLVSLVGEDREGEHLRGALLRRGIDVHDVLMEPGRQTLAKHRVLAGDQMVARFDEGTTAPPEPGWEDELAGRLAAAWTAADAVLISDYDCGLLGPRLIEVLAELQARHPRVVIVDAKRPAAFRAVSPTAVKPNFAEVQALLGSAGIDPAVGRSSAVAKQANRILELTGARVAAVTLDADGTVALERGRPPVHIHAQQERLVGATGAGDTFAAALTLALAAGGATPAAVELAAAAAAIVIGKAGTAACSRAELRARVGAGIKRAADTASLVEQIKAHRAHGRRIVFANGVFDILHRGHVALLRQARALGDVLVVAVNSDASTRRLKGPGRPINPLDDRVAVLAALDCVDHIIAFEGDTPMALLRALRPDVLVKGGDYDRDTLPEAPLMEELGGELRFLDLVEDRSTSDIIARARAS